MLRPGYLRQIRNQFKVHQVLAILGPRQCGKTTLARQYAETLRAGSAVHLFDLEDPTGLLVGTGKRMRHIRVQSPADLKNRALHALIRQAAKLQKG